MIPSPPQFSFQWVQNVLYWLQKQLVMCEWIHICTDVDNGQDVEKIIRTFLWFGNEAFCQIFEWIVMREWVHTCNDLDSEQVVGCIWNTYIIQWVQNALYY